MTSLVNKKCNECQESFPGHTLVCPHDGSQLATTLARSPIGMKLADRYELLGELGKGGMGVIYKARDLRSEDEQIVAIKLLINDTAGNDVMRSRFVQEARAASSLNHPNIIKVHEFDITPEGLPYMAMEYLEGFPLDELIELGQVDVGQLVCYTMEVCDALAHAHRRNVIHRDIKPSNIMIVRGDEGNGKAVVVDFGIAKIFAQPGKTSMRLTQTGEVFGSPLYMSPEQCMGQKLDHRSDIYAVGCLLYECLAGEPPFHGENFLNVIFQHVHEEPRGFAKDGADFILEPAVLKALQKRPEDRYQDMIEFRQALEHCYKKLSNEGVDTKYGDEPINSGDIIERYLEEVKSGNPEAYYDLALYYRFGELDEPDEELAFEWAIKAAKEGLAAAQDYVGSCFQNGYGVDIDLDQALHWYQAAAGQDQRDSLGSLGLMYALGEGVERDCLMAIKWLRRAAELDNLVSQRMLGRMFRYGEEDLEPDLEESFKWYLRAANQGDAECETIVGDMIQQGEGVEKNPETAVEWFQIAADQGYPLAQCLLAQCYALGEGVRENGFEAIKWMKEAASNGEPNALTWMGFWTIEGSFGLPQDPKKAMGYFKEAAELGDINAHYYIGDCYMKGEGVAKSEKTAVHWFKSGAKGGNLDAQYNLALCYLDGLGIEPDEKLFMKWIRRAAEGGHVESQYELGKYYKQLKKPNNARKWLSMAAEQDHKRAKKALEVLDKERN